MRIAITIWEDKISPVLDTASRLLIIDKDAKNESSRFKADLIEQDMSKRCSFIRDLDIDVLICGAVSRQLSGMLQASGINIISGISGPAEDVIEAYLNGILLRSGFFMPGSKNHHLDENNQLSVFNSAGEMNTIKGGKYGGRKKS